MDLRFPWLTAQHVRNEYPQPGEASIVAAFRDIPQVLSDLRPDADGNFCCTADELVESLRQTGHNRAAAAWAIFQGLHDQILRAKLTHSMSPELVQALISDNPNAVVPRTIPLDRYYYLKEITIASTDALWQWYREREKKTALSPFSEYVRFLGATYQDLITWTKRDEEAILLLSDNTFRARRENLIAIKRNLSKAPGKITCYPRIWTQRDQRFLDYRECRTDGFQPQRRTSRYIRTLEQRERSRFRAALNETCHDGLGAILAPKLEAAHLAFDKLYAVSISFCLDDTSAQMVSDEAMLLGSRVIELVDYIKPPQTIPEFRPPAYLQPLPSEFLPNGSIRLKAPNTEMHSKLRTPLAPKKANSARHQGRTESEVLLIAALTEHHRYYNGSIGNDSPIGCRELARKVTLTEKTASVFFKKNFGSHKKYQTMCCDTERFIAAMKALNAEFIPKDFYNARTPEDIEREADPLD